MIYYYVDYTSAYEGNSGVQRVARCLAVGLEANGEEIVYVCWNAERHSLVRANRQKLERLAAYRGPPAKHQMGEGEDLHLHDADIAVMPGSWLLVPEVTHFTSRPDGEDPTEQIIAYARRNRMRSAFVFYDLLPIERPEYQDMAARHSAYAKRLTAADLLIPISEDAGDSLRKFYANCGLRPDEAAQIKPVLLPEELIGVERGASRAETSISPVVILSLGTIEPRKNQVKLLEAFNRYCARLGARPAELHLSGHVHPAVGQDIARLAKANPPIKLHGYLQDDEVAALYRRAHFTAFVSEAEGYGLPIAESLWQGIPCLSANFGSMAEIAVNGGCHTVDTRSVTAIEDGLARLIEDGATRDRLRAEIAHARLRTWRDYAGEVTKCMTLFVPRIRALVYVDQLVKAGLNTGVQRVTRQLARGLENAGCRVGYVKWNEISGGLMEITEPDRVVLRKFSGPVCDSASGVRLGEPETWLIIPELIVERPTMQQLQDAARVAGLRTAAVLHDMVVLQRPDIYSKGTLEAFENYWRAVASTDVLLPNSVATKNDFKVWFRKNLTELTNLEPKLQALPLAAEIPGRSRSRAKFSPDAPILRILVVGTLEPRKNYEALIQAVELANTRGLAVRFRVKIVGNDTIVPAYTTKIRDLARSVPNIELASVVSDDVLKECYDECDLTVYCSVTEGFGLPIAESLWHGRPCICHNEYAIKEIADGGGTIMLDMRNPAMLASAIEQLVLDRGLLAELSEQAAGRPLRSWNDYARDLVDRLQTRMGRPMAASARLMAGCQPPLAVPLLSVSVTTYNRAPWLRHTLPQILALTAPYGDAIEVVVCDNASTDDTPQVVAEIAKGSSVRFFRNPQNVGMLGNLGVTARHSTGRFVWVIGDDDIMIPGVIENVMDAIVTHPDIHLVYLNYSYTRFDKPEELENSTDIIEAAKPISEGGHSFRADHIRDFAGLNENMFTAIYACVFRRDHALGAYQLDTRGDPFSSLPTCIPSSVYALENLMELPGYWVAAPGVVVNMNVSWLRYALIWHLERMHELYDLAEWHGVAGQQLERYRLNHVAAPGEWVKAMYFQAPDDLRGIFRMERFLQRCKHLKPVREQQLEIIYEHYRAAYDAGRLGPDEQDPASLFSSYGLPIIST